MPGSDVRMLDIYLAKQRTASIARRTPLILSSLLTERADGSVYLKLENFQEDRHFQDSRGSQQVAQPHSG